MSVGKHVGPVQPPVLIQARLWDVTNIGLNAFRLPWTSGVSYLPTPAFNAVLWLPNRSYTRPKRGAQFLKQEIPLYVSHVTAAKLRAGTNRPAGALSGLMRLDRYSQRIPGVTVSRFKVQVS